MSDRLRADLPVGRRARRRYNRLMLLAVDVGNTQTVLGLYDGGALVDALAARDRAHAHG